ncbi:MAG: LytTR family DNA-binding domain-containing protein [Bacteroidota bacterium]|nr:LytTR family DNA-binding domain-containing protein [Bacteroidota bacterium]
MNKETDQILQLLKEDRKLFLSMSFGVFLFILFFQPFPLESFDSNNRLLIVAGLGGIVLLFLVLVRAASLWIMQSYNHSNNLPTFPSYLGGFIIMALSSVAFAFYLRYVGLVEITFFVMSKVVFICLVPPIVLGIFDDIKELRQQNELLLIEKEIIGKQVIKYEEDYLNQSIEFISDNSAENLSLHVADVAFIKSADNYVEIAYKEGEHLRKKLIRNTLRNIEHQMRPFPNFIRCHRTCIVNIHCIEKLNRQYNNHWLTIKNHQEQIPVSRQYLLKLKDAI